jgi:hypothetical protein
MLKRMAEGEVILPLFFLQLTPILATLGGLNIVITKLICTFNITCLFVYVYYVRQNMDSAVFLTSEEDIEHFKLCQCSSTQDVRGYSIAHDMILVCGLVSMCWSSVALSSELASKYVSLLSAGRSADLVLNHILKNSISGAACLLELDNQEQSGSLQMNERHQQVFLFFSLSLSLHISISMWYIV